MLPLPLVRARGVFMRANTTIPIAITLTLMPVPALPFDPEEFCVAVTDVAPRMNAHRGNGSTEAHAVMVSRWIVRQKR